MRKIVLTFLLTFLVASCKKESNNSLSLAPKDLLLTTIESHGGAIFKKRLIHFNIDDTEYSATFINNRPSFSMKRTVNEVLHEAYYNGGYIEYYKNHVKQEDNSFPYQLIERSLYGSLYSYLIPHSLNTNDASLKILNDVTIRSIDYHVLSVSFTSDTEKDSDHFILYINTRTSQIEYAAIKFNLISNRPQFRRFVNARFIDGILFYDFLIFTSEDENRSINQLYDDYNNASLKYTRHVEITDPFAKPLSEIDNE